MDRVWVEPATSRLRVRYSTATLLHPLNNIVTLKSELKVTQDHSNWSKAWVRFFILQFIVTMAVSLAVCEIYSVKEWRDLENWIRGRSMSLKMVPLESSGAVFLFALYSNIWHYLVSFARYSDLLVENRNTGTWWMDRQTDRIAISISRAIKTDIDR